VRSRVRSGFVALVACAHAIAALACSENARAQTDEDAPLAATPPSPKTNFLQYGVAFVAELATQGAFCRDPQLDCILGSGGGIAFRAGFRSAGPWYFGGAYQLSKQDPTKLYRLATLQQLRAEARYYFDTGRDIAPFATGAVGVAGYGDEWAIATWGPQALIAVGIEIQSQSGPIISFSLGYHPMYLKSFEVSGGATGTDPTRGPGLAHMISLDVALEARDPL
jgi:hypothetical protein